MQVKTTLVTLTESAKAVFQGQEPQLTVIFDFGNGDYQYEMPMKYVKEVSDVLKMFLDRNMDTRHESTMI